MTVTTVFPDADPETDTVDGDVRNASTNTAWATLHDAATGDDLGPSATAIALLIRADGVTDTYHRIRRYFCLFDASAIPDSDDISAATLEFVGISGSLVDDLEPAGEITVVTTTPASNDDLVTGDFDQYGTTHQSADITLASLTVDSSTYNVLTLNATGRGNVSKTGITKFGIMHVADVDDAEPTWALNADWRVDIATAEEVLAGDKRPKLVVTHAAAAGGIVVLRRRREGA